MLGTAAGIGVHVSYTMSGLAPVVARSVLAFTIRKWAGAAYLVWIGIKAVRSRPGAELGEARPERSVWPFAPAALDRRPRSQGVTVLPGALHAGPGADHTGPGPLGLRLDDHGVGSPARRPLVARHGHRTGHERLPPRLALDRPDHRRPLRCAQHPPRLRPGGHPLGRPRRRRGALSAPGGSRRAR